MNYPRTVFFHSPYDDAQGYKCATYNGQQCTILNKITEADDTHDQEPLPMYVVRFANGVQLEAWPEELHATNTPHANEPVGYGYED